MISRFRVRHTKDSKFIAEMFIFCGSKVFPDTEHVFLFGWYPVRKVTFYDTKKPYELQIFDKKCDVFCRESTRNAALETIVAIKLEQQVLKAKPLKEYVEYI